MDRQKQPSASYEESLRSMGNLSAAMWSICTSQGRSYPKPKLNFGGVTTFKPRETLGRKDSRLDRNLFASPALTFIYQACWPM